MLEMKAADAIVQLTELTLPRGERGKVLFVPLKVTAKHEKRRLVRYGNLLIYRPSNYTLVGGHTSDTWMFRQEIPGYEYLSFHDSCWRSDGVDNFLNGLYFAMCEQVAPNVAPIRVDIEATFWHNPEIVEVEEGGVNYDRNDHKKPIVVRWR